MTTNSHHLSLSVEHYTPPDVIEAARDVLGGFELDPASCALANKTVRAARILRREDDGLRHPWRGRVFCNPPGGKTQGRSNAKLFWEKLLDEWASGETSSAVFVGFNLELLQTAQRRTDGRMASLCPLDLPICVPRERLAFHREREGALVAGNSPTHANVLVFLPDLISDVSPQLDRFRTTFEALGRVAIPEGMTDRLAQLLALFQTFGRAALRGNPP